MTYLSIPIDDFGYRQQIFLRGVGQRHLDPDVPKNKIKKRGGPIQRMLKWWPAAGGRFSKDPVTYWARQAILETMIRLL